MKRSLLILAGILVLLFVFLYDREPARNPDPNHTHADFAVWAAGEKVDLSGEKFMSGSSEDPGTHSHEGLREYLHLHDDNGDVVHRHKPGLTIGEFWQSIGGVIRNETFFLDCNLFNGTKIGCEPYAMRLYVNGELRPEGPAYAFNDLDSILITDATEGDELERQLQSLTDEACRYSRTCPERGEPPSEGCIADPEVPCVIE